MIMMNNDVLKKGSPARTNQETKVLNEFKRLNNLECLEEKHIESLSREFVVLRKENPRKYSGMSKEANRLIDNFQDQSKKGKIQPFFWLGFRIFYEKFKEKVGEN